MRTVRAKSISTGEISFTKTLFLESKH